MNYLGIDFGLRRIGLAISEGNLSTPFKTIQVKGVRDAVNKVLEVAQKEGIDKLIVGLPEGKIGKTVLGFINALKKIGLSVESTDETLSTRQATRQMIELNIAKEKRKVNDAYSAAIILQTYLDNR